MQKKKLFSDVRVKKKWDKTLESDDKKLFFCCAVWKFVFPFTLKTKTKKKNEKPFVFRWAWSTKTRTPKTRIPPLPPRVGIFSTQNPAGVEVKAKQQPL